MLQWRVRFYKVLIVSVFVAMFVAKGGRGWNW